MEESGETLMSDTRATHRDPTPARSTPEKPKEAADTKPEHRAEGLPPWRRKMPPYRTRAHGRASQP